MSLSTLVPPSIARCSAATTAAVVRIGRPVIARALAQEACEPPPFARNRDFGPVASLLALEQSEAGGSAPRHAYDTGARLQRKPGDNRTDERYLLDCGRLQIVPAGPPVSEWPFVLAIPGRKNIAGGDLHTRVHEQDGHVADPRIDQLDLVSSVISFAGSAAITSPSVQNAKTVSIR